MPRSTAVKPHAVCPVTDILNTYKAIILIYYKLESKLF